MEIVPYIGTAIESIQIVKTRMEIVPYIGIAIESIHIVSTVTHTMIGTQVVQRIIHLHRQRKVGV